MAIYGHFSKKRKVFCFNFPVLRNTGFHFQTLIVIGTGMAIHKKLTAEICGKEVLQLTAIEILVCL